MGLLGSMTSDLAAAMRTVGVARCSIWDNYFTGKLVLKPRLGESREKATSQPRFGRRGLFAELERLFCECAGIASLHVQDGEQGWPEVR